jgi:hypothetical protein
MFLHGRANIGALNDLTQSERVNTVIPSVFGIPRFNFKVLLPDDDYDTAYNDENGYSFHVALMFLSNLRHMTTHSAGLLVNPVVVKAKQWIK